MPAGVDEGGSKGEGVGGSRPEEDWASAPKSSDSSDVHLASTSKRTSKRRRERHRGRERHARDGPACVAAGAAAADAATVAGSEARGAEAEGAGGAGDDDDDRQLSVEGPAATARDGRARAATDVRRVRAEARRADMTKGGVMVKEVKGEGSRQPTESAGAGTRAQPPLVLHSSSRTKFLLHFLQMRTRFNP